MNSTKYPSRHRGFTIVELMIALAVFSVILVMASAILIRIGGLYSKGVDSANLQNTARNIVDDISAGLQFSGNTPVQCQLNGIAPITIADSTTCYANLVTDTPSSLATGPFAFCIGTTRYSYVLNQELGTDQGTSPASTTQHVLWRDSLKQPAAVLGCQPVSDLETAAIPSDVDTDTNTGGYEMVPEHMRLLRFEVVPDPNASGIYDIDVWMAYGDSDLLNMQLLGNSSDPGNWTCKGQQGDQFCATSELSTEVVQRVAGN